MGMEIMDHGVYEYTCFRHPLSLLRAAEWTCSSAISSKTKNDFAGFNGVSQQPGAIQNAMREVALWESFLVLQRGHVPAAPGAG